MSNFLERVGEIVAPPGRQIKSVSFQVVVETEPIDEEPGIIRNRKRPEVLTHVYELIPQTGDLILNALGGNEQSQNDLGDFTEQFDTAGQLLLDNLVPADRSTRQDILNFLVDTGMSEGIARLLTNQYVRKISPKSQDPSG